MPEILTYKETEVERISVFTCYKCGREYSADEIQKFDGKTLCEGCYDEYTVICELCGDRVWLDNSQSDDNIYVCQDCYDNNYHRCTECDCLVHADNASH